jgi:hypothetical protein
MYDIQHLFQLDYWFAGFSGINATMIAPVLSKYTPGFWIFISFFVSLVVIACILIATTQFLHSEHPLVKKAPVINSNLITMGYLGLFWLFCRTFEVAFLGGRFWLLAGGVYFICFVVWLVRYFILYFKPIEYPYFKKTYVTNR